MFSVFNLSASDSVVPTPDEGASVSPVVKERQAGVDKNWRSKKSSKGWVQLSQYKKKRANTLGSLKSVSLLLSDCVTVFVFCACCVSSVGVGVCGSVGLAPASSLAVVCPETQLVHYWLGVKHASMESHADVQCVPLELIKLYSRNFMIHAFESQTNKWTGNNSTHHFVSKCVGVC